MNEIRIKSSKRVVVNDQTINITCKNGIENLFRVCSLEELKYISEELGNPIYSIEWGWTIYQPEWKPYTLVEEVYDSYFDYSNAFTVVSGPLGTLPDPILLEELQEKRCKLVEEIDEVRRLQKIEEERLRHNEEEALALITPGTSLTVLSMNKSEGLIVEVNGYTLRVAGDVEWVNYEQDAQYCLKVNFIDY